MTRSTVVVGGGATAPAAAGGLGTTVAEWVGVGAGAVAVVPARVAPSPAGTVATPVVETEVDELPQAAIASAATARLNDSRNGKT